MQVDTIVRIVFSVLLAATLAVGVYLFKNFERLFGYDPSVPTDNSGAQGVNKVQIISIWAHAVALTAAMAFFG